MDFNVADEFKSLQLDQVQAYQKKNCLPYSIGLLNLKGGLNIGNIIRTAVIFGAERVYIIGRKRFDRRSTVGAQNYVDLKFIEKDVNDESQQTKILDEIFCDGYTPSFIEQGGYDINCANFYYSPKQCLIFGEEAVGIPRSMMIHNYLYGGEVFSIPQVGVLRSLNVASAAAIVMNKVAMDLKVLPK
jgi:tRNA G18 (ribose-2'-O)-methylase SpoU